MAKAELFKGWLGSWLMPRLNTYPVHRGRVDRQTIAQTLSILKEGGVLLLFPEGTTAQDGEIHDAKGGMAVFAFKTDSPVVPTYISGTGAKKQRTRLRVQFGKPLYPKDFRHPDLSPNAQQDIFTEAVMTAIQQMANR
jgi:1-acyl-sn-glycerol-3-phosphate acyltransferase